MIRPFTCLCLAAACGSGLYLYSEKHRTALLDRQISSIVHQTEAARERTGLLRAEWALLNEPGRLQDMANKYLALKPMAPTQFVSLADLESRLPAPLPPNAAVPDDQTDADDDTTAPPAGANQQPAVIATGAATGDQHARDAAGLADGSPVAKPTDGKPAQSKVANARQPGGKSAKAPAATRPAEAIAGDDPPDGDPAVAAADDKPDEARTGAARTGSARLADAKAGNKLLARADLKTKTAHHAADAPAYGHDGLLARGTPLPLAAPQPHAQVFSAMAHPMVAAARPAVVAATPRYVPYIGSALSNGGALPPPTPYTGDR